MSGYCRPTAERALLLAVALLLSACYSFTGGGLPDHVRTIYIAPLDNDTQQFDLPQQLARAMSERVPRALGLRPAGERTADAVLRASITDYQDAAQNYRAGRPGEVEVLQHQVQINVMVRIIDVRQNVVLFEQSLSGNGQYRPDEQTDEVARARAIEMLIDGIINGAQSQW
ncbi:MAG TPA: LPS assembly lipoprotein LptE [Longimicrobiales bacterium]|nr:LPS assembly lipoprotein LptE [Longimicrobiales bacterium]